MTTKSVLTAIDPDGIATITFNRPEVHNAIDETVIAEFKQALAKVAKDPRARIVVIGGHGTSFCAGADLNWMKRTSRFTEEQNFRDAQEFTELLTLLDRMPKPTVARVHGPVYGGGVGIVVACDIAIGSRDAVFCFSEVRLGLIPAMISPYAVAAIGERQTRRYMLTAERIDAAEAFRIGLLHDLCEGDDLDDTIGRLAGHVLRAGPDAIAACKTLIARVARAPLDTATIEYTARAIAATRASPEGKEGIGAFLDKRQPGWVAGAGVPAPKKTARTARKTARKASR
jgi:methylglutaconyl-CoA hydratase